MDNQSHQDCAHVQIQDSPGPRPTSAAADVQLISRQDDCLQHLYVRR